MIVHKDECRDRQCVVGPAHTCCGAGCMAWRWWPLTTDEPGYMAAVKAAIGTTPEGREKPLTAQTAPTWVNANRARLGLLDVPYRGYCGLAGKPEV